VPALVVGVVTFLAFLPVLQADFVSWDDNRNFTGNPEYRGLGWTQLKWMWTTTLMGHYIPLSWMTLGADYVLWGMDARGYHLTNLLLHCAATVALYFVIVRLLEAALVTKGNLRIAAAAGALLFGVHPLRVESVAWITERRDVLSLLLMLVSILLYLEHRRTDRNAHYAGALTTFVLALLAKASVVTLPAVLLVIEAYPLRALRGVADPESRRVWRRLAPFFALSALAGVLSVLVLNPPRQLGLVGKIAVSAFSLRFYVEKTLLPLSLSPLYPLPKTIDPVATKFILSYLFVVALVAVTWVLRRRWPAVSASLVAAGFLVLPLLGVVQNGPQIAADRYTYHAAVALSMLPVLALLKYNTPWLKAVAGVVIVSLAVITTHQSGYWRNSEALWTRVVSVDSTSDVGLVAMGDVRIAQGRTEEALSFYSRAVRIDPDYPEGHNNLGSLLAQVGRLEEAIVHYQAALRLKPSYPEAELNWGVALARLGRSEEALIHYQRALGMAPTLKDAHLQVGNALLRLGRRGEAMKEYEAELRAHPGNAVAHLNWGVALAQESRFANAVEHFDKALELNPRLSEAAEYRREAMARLRR
jgi:tetratricopeptide (TPR) repeat protein